MIDPAEGYSSVYDALTEAEQKGPGLFFLQQGFCFLPAHEPHDGPEAHMKKSLVNWETQRLNPYLHTQETVLRLFSLTHPAKSPPSVF